MFDSFSIDSKNSSISKNCSEGAKYPNPIIKSSNCIICQLLPEERGIEFLSFPDGVNAMTPPKCCLQVDLQLCCETGLFDFL